LQIPNLASKKTVPNNAVKPVDTAQKTHHTQQKPPEAVVAIKTAPEVSKSRKASTRALRNPGRCSNFEG
jgi:hypothetical protein